MNIKHLIATLLFFCVQIAYCQSLSERYFQTKNGKVIYEGVVEIPRLDSSQLYKKALITLFDQLRLTKDDVLIDIPNQLILIETTINTRKKFWNEFFDIKESLWYKFSLHFKNGKYKYKLYDITNHTSVPVDNNQIYIIENFDDHLDKKHKKLLKKGKINSKTEKIYRDLNEAFVKIYLSLEEHMRLEATDDLNW